MHNVIVLALAQMLASSGMTVVVILGGIVTAQMAPPSLATVPLSLGIVAVALTTVPAALLMRRVGRRAGFIIGAGIGMLGGLVAARAISAASFGLFCVGTGLLGASIAFTQQYRFAAAESVPVERCSRAISYVLIGSLGAAILNPQLALAARNWLFETEYAGSFIAVSLMYLAAMLVLVRLRPVQPTLAHDLAADVGRPAAPFGSQFRTAVFAGAVAYAVMSFIMTAAPISMHNVHQHDVQATTWVIQSHVLAMYLPSLFTGHLIARFGERTIMMWGGALLASCAAVSVHGHELMHYWVGLVVLGLGWNLLFVAGTTLLARSIEGPVKHRAQAINEFTVFGSQACASLLAGLAVQTIGWQALNIATLPLLAIMMIAAMRLPNGQTAAARVPASDTSRARATD